MIVSMKFFLRARARHFKGCLKTTYRVNHKDLLPRLKAHG